MVVFALMSRPINPPLLGEELTHELKLDFDVAETGVRPDGCLAVAPAGADDEHLPIGVQIVGPRWSELRLVEVGRALEAVQVLPGFRPPPDLTR